MKLTVHLRGLSMLAAVWLLLIGAPALQSAEWGVAESGRHITLHGKPFFWIGDTSWLLAQVPSREEVDAYLKARASQGFTVIQCTAVMGEERVWGTARASTFGDLPFVDHDPSKPSVTPGNVPADSDQYDYWDHLDYVLDRVHAHGMRVALVTYFVGWRGEGYNYLTPERAYAYGRFLGERFRGKPEIIWLLGGDNTPDTDGKKAVWTRVAKGITEGFAGTEDYSKTLMTYHINGGASSGQIWHSAPWLDFNMTQTWSDYQNIEAAVRRDYQREPIKPCGLGEGAYEDGPQYPTKPINALVIRKQACWSYFAGGYHTYGNGNVWHFDTLKAELTQPWKEALHSPGAASLTHVKDFLTRIDWPKFVPDQALFPDGQGTGATLNVAMRRSDGGAAAVYLSSAAPVKLRLETLRANGPFQATWTNPANGETKSFGRVAKETAAFTPPAGWTDALLLLKAAPAQ